MLRRPLALLQLAPEILSRVLTLLDIEDLLHIAQACKTLRALATDPLLHQRRLKAVPAELLPALSARTPRRELLKRGTPLISLNPQGVGQHLHSPTAAYQIRAFIALSCTTR